MGHSLGGAFLGYYSLYHPERVTKAYFVSSAGFSQKVFSRHDLEESIEKFNYFKKYLFKFGIWSWDKRITPINLASWLGFLKKPLLSKFMNRWSGKLKPEVRELLSQYIIQIFQFSMPTDKVILNLFDIGVKPFYPLDLDRKTQKTSYFCFDVECAFFYGDRDWMYRICGNGPKSIIRRSKGKYTLDILNDSGHHLEICNPYDLVSKILMRSGIYREDFKIEMKFKKKTKNKYKLMGEQLLDKMKVHTIK